jgi:anti-sigma factor RsiW
MNQTHPTPEQLIDYVHGELASSQDAAIHTHLATCAACAQAHDGEVRLGELLRAHARAETLDLPPGLVTSIYARTASDAGTPWWQRLSASMRAAAAVPIAATVALIIYFAVSGWHATVKNGTGTLDAAYYMENHAALSTNTPFEAGDALPTVLTADETGR